ncbi:MAG: chloramphenicol acetyltransferase [Clostridiales bacterium]|nr:chloramphenicol acetyltransferase [Clostridiales bacterium]
MNYTTLNMDSYPRKDHFAYFSTLAFPYVGITVNVDITDWLRVVKARRLPFFLSFLYALNRAVNAIPELRQRIYNRSIIQYDSCPCSYTVALDNGTYCYCCPDFDRPYRAFISHAKKMQKEAMEQARIDETQADSLPLIFVSSMPWASVTSLVQPAPIPADSNPRILLSKYFVQEQRTLIPISIQCNHALVDGIHLGRFYHNLTAELQAMLPELEHVIL